MLHPIFILAAFFLAGDAVGGIEQGSLASKGTGLIKWYWRNGTFSFSTQQRLPDQTRAFFLGRGLPKEAVESLATSCIFQAEIRNLSASGGQPVTIELDSWRISHKDESAPPVLASEWKQRFQRLGLRQDASIALRWSLFPEEQTFEPGDYNWGMISYGPKPNERFDLTFVWYEGSEKHQATLTRLVCAEDK